MCVCVCMCVGVCVYMIIPTQYQDIVYKVAKYYCYNINILYIIKPKYYLYSNKQILINTLIST